MKTRDRLSERLTPLLKRIIENGPAGNACTVVRRGKTLYREGFGYADLDSKREIGADTLYRIYSMTKVVTCVAALQLYEKGLFKLDDPIGDYLPAYSHAEVFRNGENGSASTSPSDGPILIKHLFTMTSGLTYGGEASETERRTQSIMDKAALKFDTRSAAEALAEVPLAFDPGSRWQYGTSHDVLGALIEAVSGRTLGQYMKAELFEPLAMTETSFRVSEDNRHRLCTMYDYAKGETLKPNDRLDACYEPGCAFESGGAGLLSTIGDYSRFAQALARGGELDGERILSPHTIRLMATNHLDEGQLRDYNGQGYGYGLGVRVLMDPVPRGINATIGEFGWAGLAGSYLLIDPKEELSVVYMQQMLPSLEPQFHPLLRNVVYGALD